VAIAGYPSNSEPTVHVFALISLQGLHGQ